MDYSYKAIVDRIRDDSIEYTGLNWQTSDSPVTKYPNLVAWIDAHGKCDGAFRLVCSHAAISPGALMIVINEGAELPDSRLEKLVKLTGMSLDTIKSATLDVMEDYFIPELMAASFEECFGECQWFNMNWLKDSKAVSVYYDMKRGIHPPAVYWDYIGYVIMRNKRYRGV